MEAGSVTTENWITLSPDYYGSGYVNYDSCPLQELPFAYIFIPILYFMNFLIGFFGNLFVILLMARKQGSKRLVDTFVLNLAVADLVFVCTLPFWALSKALGYWCFGEGLCKVCSYTVSVNRCSSILFLMGMSVERFLVVTKQKDSRSIGTKKITGVSCGCIWMVSFLLGMPSLFYRKLIPTEDTSKSLCEDEEPAIAYSLVFLILTFLLPLGVILFCYCSIFSKLQGHISLSKRRNNALKIIFAIIGAFLCSWLPFNALNAFLIFIMIQKVTLSCQASMTFRWGMTISACLAFTNSCINPIIYVFMDQHFRQQVTKNIPDLCSTRENAQSSTLSFTSTESSLLFANRKKLTPASSAPVEDTYNKGTGF
ncbi:probable G-protein coupled receptor 25 [Tiliqua scincoides]|uniref:probable G-protein coupled receptor 25 n=1 Tax=Tiliqua scincoides TaxID=71010 RepID=UPI00346270C8